MASLATCLCATLAEEGAPQPCFCGVLPGEIAVADYATGCDDASKDGMAWVRLTTAYPAKGVGRVSEDVGNCGTELGVEFEMGILRCFPVPDDGEAPSPEEMLAAAEQQHHDLLIMRKALFCCDALPNNSYILSAYRPSGPLGGVYGGSFGIMLVI